MSELNNIRLTDVLNVKNNINVNKNSSKNTSTQNSVLSERTSNPLIEKIKNDNSSKSILNISNDTNNPLINRLNKVDNNIKNTYGITDTNKKYNPLLANLNEASKSTLSTMTSGAKGLVDVFNKPLQRALEDVTFKIIKKRYPQNYSEYGNLYNSYKDGTLQKELEDYLKTKYNNKEITKNEYNEALKNIESYSKKLLKDTWNEEWIKNANQETRLITNNKNISDNDLNVANKIGSTIGNVLEYAGLGLITGSPIGAGAVSSAISSYGDQGNIKDVTIDSGIGALFGAIMQGGEKILNVPMQKLGTNIGTKIAMGLKSNNSNIWQSIGRITSSILEKGIESFSASEASGQVKNLLIDDIDKKTQKDILDESILSSIVFMAMTGVSSTYSEYKLNKIGNKLTLTSNPQSTLVGQDYTDSQLKEMGYTEFKSGNGKHTGIWTRTVENGGADTILPTVQVYMQNGDFVTMTKKDIYKNYPELAKQLEKMSSALSNSVINNQTNNTNLNVSSNSETALSPIYSNVNSNHLIGQSSGQNIISKNTSNVISSNVSQNKENPLLKIFNEKTSKINTSNTTSPVYSEINKSMVEENNNSSEKINKENNLIIQIQNAIKNKNSVNKNYLGKVKDNIASKIESIIGINVSNRKHVLTDNDIRHMIKQHGDPIKEAKKGQIAITEKDILKIPDIINNPNDIINGTRNKLGKTIRYIKKYNDNMNYVVEVVPEKSNSLIIKTMWKKPYTLTNEQILSSTPETKGTDISSTISNSISQEQNYVKSNDILTETPQKYNADKNINDLKEKQLNIINKNNPMLDDYHTGIRNIDDIKTLEETLHDGDWSDYDEFDPDLTRQDIENAIKTGKIEVYSSNPIEQGVFVTPSKMEAESYSSDGKIYSKKVNIQDVAWIDPTQGQYAKVESTNDIINETPLQLEKNIKEKSDSYYPHELKSAIKKDFEISGYVNLTGIKINNPQELVEIAQIFRNPYYEITRILFFNKNNTLLGYDSFSAHKVNESYATQDTGTDSINNLKQKMNDLGADYIVHLHNHPSGDPRPSTQDLKAIQILNEFGIKTYGLVIDHNKYSYIKENSYNSDFLFIKGGSEDYILDNIGKVTSIDELAKISANTQHKYKNMIVFTDTKNNIRSIHEAPDKFIKNNDRFKEYITTQLKNTGSMKVFTSSKNSLLKPLLEKYVRSGILQDSFFEDTNSSLMQIKEIAEENKRNTIINKQESKKVYDDFSTVRRKSDIKVTSTGIKYVQISENFFENIPDDQRPKYLMKYIQDNLAGKIIKTDDGTEIHILDKGDNKLGELVYAKTIYDKRIGKDITDKLERNKVRFEIKGNIVNNLENLIKISKVSKHKEDIDQRHGNFALNGFDTRYSYLYDGQNVYKVDLDIAIDNNEVNNLYAIKNIQKRNSIQKVDDKSSHDSELSSNKVSITQEEKNVNSSHNIINEEISNYNEKRITLEDGTSYNLEEYKEKFGDDSEEAFNTIYDMQNALPKNKKSLYSELKSKYDKSDYDNSILMNAQNEITANKQGRRTKEQWLNVAKIIGNNIQNENDVEKIAYKTWIDSQPNKKENLNRQGKRFVPFTLEEWVDAVKQGYELKPEYDNPPPSENNGKQSKWVTTSFENEKVRKNINKKNLENVTYIVKGDEQTLELVNNMIDEKGYEKCLEEIGIAFDRKDEKVLAGKVYTGYTKEEAVMAQRLLQIAIDRKDIKTAENLISQIAIAGSRAGQSIQALSLINKLSPQGQLLHLERLVERINQKLENNNKSEKNEKEIKDLIKKEIKKATDKVNNELINISKIDSDDYNDLAKRLAKKISNVVDPKTQIKNNKIQQEIVNELFRVAKESPITIEDRVKSQKMSALEKLQLALEKKELYKDTWNKAKNIIKKKYKNDTEILEKLDNYFDKGIVPNYSMETINKAYEDLLKEKGINASKSIQKKLDTVATKNLKNIYKLREDQQKEIVKDVALTLIKETKANKQDAQILATSIVNNFFNSLKEHNINELIKGISKYNELEITDEMKEKILTVKNTDELNNVMEEVKQEVADQIPATISDKVRTWRYFSMLFNPVTHIRNMIGNSSMSIVAKGKNIISRGIETTLDNKLDERTRTFKKSTEEIKKFADEDVEKMMDTLTGENKLSMENKIMQKRKIFKTEWMEKLQKFNSNMLEKEDAIALKKAYKSNLSEYLTANGIETISDIKNNSETVEKARTFAIQEALKATFRQDSNLASLLQQIENRYGIIGQILVGGVIPFKKTPINITKTSVRYSPVGLIWNLTKEANDLKNGKISANEFIDNLAAGLTGTAIATLGLILLKAGIITAGSDDSKEDKYKKQIGWKPYSIRIGNKYYSLSWLSPSAVPLFIGAEVGNQIKKDNKLDFNSIAEAIANATNPLMDMSMLQGINDVLSSYSSDGILGNIGNTIKSAGENYLLQYIPTISSKLASFLDSKQRTTKVSKNSKAKEIETLVRQAMYKIPGLRNMLEESTDIWGNTKINSDNIVTRFLENFVLPTYGSDYSETNVDKNIINLYNKTGEESIIPSVPNNYLTYDNQKYEMSAKEYTQYKKTYGQTLNNNLKYLFNSEAYKNLSDENKIKMVKKMYIYASETAKKEYLNSQKVTYNYSTSHILYDISKKFLNNNSVFENLYYTTQDIKSLPVDNLNNFTYKNQKYTVSSELKKKYAEESYKKLSSIYKKLSNSTKFKNMSNDKKLETLSTIRTKYLKNLKKSYRIQVIKNQSAKK